MSPPDWDDYEAVEKYVIELLDCDPEDLIVRELPPYRMPWLPRPAVESDAEIARLEQLAVKAGWIGDFDQLARLIEPILWIQDGAICTAVNPAIFKLEADTWSLIARRLTGDPMFDPPKPPRKRGGSKKKTRDKREGKYPSYKAAFEVLIIIDILKSAYPDVKQKDIRDRACLIAEDRHELTTDLYGYMRRRGFFKPARRSA